jgi:hypothetical protein
MIPERGWGECAPPTDPCNTALDAFAWTNNTVRVLARNVSGGAFDLAAATLLVAVIKRRIP